MALPEHQSAGSVRGHGHAAQVVGMDPGEGARLVEPAHGVGAHGDIVRGLPRGDVVAVVQRPIQAVDRVDDLPVQRLLHPAAVSVIDKASTRPA